MSTVVSTLSRSLKIVASSAKMQEILQRAALFADSDAPVVVLGESGTGKEVIVRVLHANSPRRDRPFVAVNVAALSAELLESELFGHAKGAFTGAATERRGLFEAAHGGVLFLDEIGEMPLPMQAKLLRALQDGEVRRVGETQSFAVDVRIVCATHRDLPAQIAKGLFREDLYYRLKVLNLRVPALRERRQDILPLIELFLANEGRPHMKLTAAAARRVTEYAWPGNVRELASAVKFAVAVARNKSAIDVEHLPDELCESTAASVIAQAAGRLQSLAEAERAHILFVLEQCGGNQMEAARILEIGRNTLWRKLKEASP
jgi:two-component system response regulator HydG